MRISTLQVVFVTTVVCCEPDCEVPQIYSFKGKAAPEGKLLPSEKAEEFVKQHLLHTGHRRIIVQNDEKIVTIYTH